MQNIFLIQQRAAVHNMSHNVFFVTVWNMHTIMEVPLSDG